MCGAKVSSCADPSVIPPKTKDVKCDKDLCRIDSSNIPPMTKDMKCDKGLCYVEMMFSYINDLLLEKKLITQPVRFSVHHFIQHIFNFSMIPDDRLKIEAKFPLPINIYYIESYLASGCGPVLYEDDPCEITIDSLKANNNKYKNKKLKVPFFIGTINRVLPLKKGVQKALEHTHLLAGKLFLLDGCLNKDKECYFHGAFSNMDAIQRNDYHHCVKIIGYDDNYPKENFNKISRFPDDVGAALAEINCIEGISRLWISDDVVIHMIFLYIADISINTNIYNVYEYDILGSMNRMTIPIKEEFINTENGNFYICRTGSMKNVFKTRNPGKEYLEYIKFMLARVFDFEIIVMNGNEIAYHHIFSEGNEGTKYYSHELLKPILLTAESFSIEIKIKGMTAVEFTDDVVDIEPNISFLNGVDITDKETERNIYNFDRVQGHCCIKALTTSASH